MEKGTLWLPDGFGIGTIIFDKNGNAYEAKKLVMSGVGIYEIEQINKEYADIKIKAGVAVLKAKEE